MQIGNSVRRRFTFDLPLTPQIEMENRSNDSSLSTDLWLIED
jgi:hypothetical protein